MANGDDTAPVDHRAAPDMGQIGNHVGAFDRTQALLPQQPAAISLQRDKLSRRVGNHHDAVADRRAGAAQKAGGFGKAGVGPQPFAVFGVDGEQLIVDRGHEYPAGADRRRATRRAGDALTPDFSAVGGIQGNDLGEPGADVNSPILKSDTAGNVAFVFLVRGQVRFPQPLSTDDAVGADHGR